MGTVRETDTKPFGIMADEEIASTNGSRFDVARV
jgi:hypothetical protein